MCRYICAELKFMQLKIETFSTPLSYSDYKQLLSEENILTMPEHLQAYTRLNAQRMSRWEKTYQPSMEIEKLDFNHHEPLRSYIITEPWCGDAAHCIPAIHKLLGITKGMMAPIFLLRDQNLELMDNFLTLGKRSIPILLITDNRHHLLGVWGPRPSAAQELVDRAKQSGDADGRWKEELQVWYNHNKQVSLESEYAALIMHCHDVSKNC